jgi:hypothetical protein
MRPADAFSRAAQPLSHALLGRGALFSGLWWHVLDRRRPIAAQVRAAEQRVARMLGLRLAA